MKVDAIVNPPVRTWRWGARELIEAMEPVVRVTFEGRRGGMVTEAGPLQRKTAEAFGLELEP